ncbi:hypothetical protein EDD76_10153 [Kineothrix alysoides]|uniref:DUF5666 domain-containing protein n=1 Tax=Kineothrix alysoides TaxID=1469948 RepID=A0A4R1R5Y7_9FIRM|nr:DUF4179 domain-containing protein [Kineothrix alysoides]TCL60956.1 hypothetical protein EDD76_10153 [Kineothrix alysoides]
MKQESKKRKRRQKTAIAVILLIGVVCFTGFTMTAKSASQSNQVQITAGKNEELIYARLMSVIGNDITCTLTESGEEKEYEIPVGTDVITRLGTVTTFSKLSEGNNVAILLEKGTDIVKSVWITE